MDATTPFNGSQKLDYRGLSARLVLFLLFAAALFSLTKGLSSLSIAGEPYWVINYENGLIRRGLLGQIFSFFIDQNDLERVLWAAFYVHITACILLLIGLWSWLRILLNRGGDRILLAIFAIFATSPFLATQALTCGFLDIYLYILIFLAAIAIAREWYVPAAVIGFVAPFVHEGFLFLWFTLVALVIWEGFTFKRFLVLLSPLVATIIVYFGSTKSAAIAEMAKAPLTHNIKDMMLQGQLGLTIRSDLDYMLFGQYQIHFDHFLIALVLFTPPAAIMMWAYAANRRNRYDIFAFVAASFAPATLWFFGSDLSRFMVSIYFSTLLAVLYMQTIRPVVTTHFPIVVACWIVAALGLLTPLVYADFERAIITDNGIIPSESLVIGKAIRPLLYSPKHFPPSPPHKTRSSP